MKRKEEQIFDSVLRILTKCDAGAQRIFGEKMSPEYVFALYDRLLQARGDSSLFQFCSVLEGDSVQGKGEEQSQLAELPLRLPPSPSPVASSSSPLESCDVLGFPSSVIESGNVLTMPGRGRQPSFHRSPLVSMSNAAGEMITRAERYFEKWVRYLRSGGNPQSFTDALVAKKKQKSLPSLNVERLGTAEREALESLCFHPPDCRDAWDRWRSLHIKEYPHELSAIQELERLRDSCFDGDNSAGRWQTVVNPWLEDRTPVV